MEASGPRSFCELPNENITSYSLLSKLQGFSSRDTRDDFHLLEMKQRQRLPNKNLDVSLNWNISVWGKKIIWIQLNFLCQSPWDIFENPEGKGGLWLIPREKHAVPVLTGGRANSLDFASYLVWTSTRLQSHWKEGPSKRQGKSGKIIVLSLSHIWKTSTPDL